MAVPPLPFWYWAKPCSLFLLVYEDPKMTPPVALSSESLPAEDSSYFFTIIRFLSPSLWKQS